MKSTAASAVTVPIAIKEGVVVAEQHDSGTAIVPMAGPNEMYLKRGGIISSSSNIGNEQKENVYA